MFFTVISLHPCYFPGKEAIIHLMEHLEHQKYEAIQFTFRQVVAVYALVLMLDVIVFSHSWNQLPDGFLSEK